ncbi:CPBP family intramembrane metalloprotease [Tropicimonas sp. IMCC6043]|nr:CPBP family intramembrane metalloprotease [Tropicimonas sp. IMCC6043]
MVREPAPPSTMRLWAEFLGFFVAAPLAMALLVPPRWMFPALFAVTAFGIVLLHLTASFRWRDLAVGIGRTDLRLVAGIFALVLAFGAALLAATRPGALFALPRYEPALMAMIFVLYPLVSALPQEIVYRALFFRRYAPILTRSPRAALLLNAGLFSLAHLMYWSWLVLVMTFLGGMAFAWAYEVRRSFPLAWLMHAAAGNAIFLAGLGLYFYSGNVVRPF